MAGNNALNNQIFDTQVSTNNSTRFATTEYLQSIINNYNTILSSVNAWSADQHFLTQTSGTNNTRMATTQFCDSMTYSMNANAITGIHTVLTASGVNGVQIANLDYTKAKPPNLESFFPIVI